MDCALLQNLFLDSENSDVEVHIETSGGENIVVPAHSLVLKQASTVFKAMLETGNFKESLTGEIEIKVQGDISDAIFFLRYLYTKELKDVDLGVYISLIQSAHLYEINSLVQLCEKKIIGQLTPLSVCRVYNLLQNIGSEHFLRRCQELMLQSAFLIFSKDLHLTVTEETIRSLLSSDHLNVLDEEQVVGALWKWGCVKHCQNKSTTNKTIVDHLENLLQLIRWTFVKDVKENYPWYTLMSKIKSEIDSGGRSVLPASANLRTKRVGNVSLFRYADVCSLITELKDKKEIIVMRKRPISLLMFTVTRDVFLVGFTIELTSTLIFEEKLPFRIYLNETDLTDLVTEERKLLCTYKCEKTKILNVPFSRNTEPVSRVDHRTQVAQRSVFDMLQKGTTSETEEETTKNVYIINIELFTPILLRSSTVFRILLNSTQDSSSFMCLPAYNLKCSREPARTMFFNVLDLIKGLHDLRYFPL